MHFCEFWQNFDATDLHKFPGRSLHRERNPLGENDSELFAFIFEPQDKLLPGQNRGGSHGDIRLCFRLLFDLDPPPGIDQRA